MKSRALIYAFSATLAAFAVSSCAKVDPRTEVIPGEDEVTDEGTACVMFTRAGAGADARETYRMSSMYNGTEEITLLSDGAYCGYTNPDKSWLYPCKVDDAGNALDAADAIIPWDAADWFDRTVNDTRYGLRVRPLKQEAYTSLVVCSPARRMQKYDKDGNELEYGVTVPAEKKPVKWGYLLDNESGEDFYISDAVRDIKFTYSMLDGQYIYDVPLELKDKRARINVVVACGALAEANLYAVNFKNVMTQVWYQPRDMVYDFPVMDRGEIDPYLAYTRNSYPVSGTQTGEGNMLRVPESDPDIHLTQRPGRTGDFTEWDKTSNTGTAVTAIHSFPVFSLDYGKMDGDRYVYEALIPKIEVWYGTRGSVKSTVRLTANVEPMKEYTVIVYLSTAFVSAELYVSDWTQAFASPLDVRFGECVSLPVDTENLISPWTQNPAIPIDDGKIEDPE